MASRRLEDLIPPVRDRAFAFVEACVNAGIEVLIYCTRRSVKEQNDLYAIGRTLPGKIVTNAKGGSSCHNYGAAFDFVPIINGKPQWSDAALYRRCGEIAKQCGLEWAGEWKTFKETAHCQYTGGLTIDELKGGARIL